jgi:hypothetical protein
MTKVSVILLLVLCGAGVGCETGSITQNVSTTGWKGQKVGQNADQTSGLVTSSTTATPGNLEYPQPKPPQDSPVATQNLDSD